MVKLLERQNSKSMVVRSSPGRCVLFLCHMTHFPLLGKDKFPLGVEYIFESKFPLVVRIGLAARACGSGNGQSPSNSVLAAGALLCVVLRPISLYSINLCCTVKTTDS